MAILRCISPFTYWVNGAPRTYTAGQLIEDTDPGYAGREAHFETVETHVSARAGRVEQATAEPGEKRTRRQPARKAAAKADSSKSDQAGDAT